MAASVRAPNARRQALASKHQQARVRQGHSTRQRLRLILLRLAGRLLPAPSPSVPLPDPPRRILVVRPDHLGDLLFATPALHLLRRHHPDAQITALVGPWGEPVLAGNPDLDQVLTCPFPGFTRQPKSSPWQPYRLLQAEARRLRALAFDLALILRFDHWWGAWLAAAAHIPRRVGYHIAEVRPFLTRPVTYIPGRHEVLQNLGLVLALERPGGVPTDRPVVASVGEADLKPLPEWGLRFPVTASQEHAASRLLMQAGVDEHRAGPLVALHPGSGAAVKRWRSEAWARLACELAERRQAQIVFTGSRTEAELIGPVLQALPSTLRPPPLSLAGRTDLGCLAALYRRCDLVIGPDSGPLHLAVAMGTPTIHLYGPVDARAFGPWGTPDRHRVLTSAWECIPCNRLDWPEAELAEHGCVRDISVSQVLDQALELLSRA